MKRFYYRICEGRTVVAYVDAEDKKAADEKLEHQQYTVLPEYKKTKIKGYPGAELIKTADYVLEPCPFCGKQAILKDGEELWDDSPPEQYFQVGCEDINCIGNIDIKYSSAKEAADNWNKRFSKEE